MRALLLADSCNPEWPSLPVVGFKMCQAIGDLVDTVVVTQVRNRPNIEKVGMRRCEVVYIDNEYIGRPMYKLTKIVRGGSAVGWTTNVAMFYPTYLSFEYEVRKKFGQDLKDGKFDIVHRVTPMSPTLPSPMAKWSPRPFVLGPLNGGLAWPPEFRQELVREKNWLTFVRDAYRWLPYQKATYRHAAAILAAFQHTIDDLPKECRDRVFNVPEVGVDLELFSAPPERPKRDRLTFLFAGRLVPVKCIDAAVNAFAASPALQKHRLRIVGEGPEQPRLEQIVREHHLEGCVEFVGQRTQAEVGEEMRKADVFVFPSIHELGAGVVVEAMVSGLACVVVDYGAPGTLINADRGLRVPIGPKAEMTQGFTRALEDLAAHPERIAPMGQAAADHVLKHYTWDAKARDIVEIYRWILKERKDRPVPGV